MFPSVSKVVCIKTQATVGGSPFGPFISVDRVQSYSCEWLKHTSENGGTPPTVALVSTAVCPEIHNKVVGFTRTIVTTSLQARESPICFSLLHLQDQFSSHNSCAPFQRGLRYLRYRVTYRALFPLVEVLNCFKTIKKRNRIWMLRRWYI